MMKTITIWILAGALVASLRWNLMSSSTDDSPAQPQDVQGQSPTGVLACGLNPSSLGISAEQCQALESYCRNRSGSQQELESKAERQLAALRLSLGQSELEESALRQQVEEVSATREAALNACVAEILRVRSILDAPQIQRLMKSCCPKADCEFQSSFQD